MFRKTWWLSLFCLLTSCFTSKHNLFSAHPISSFKVDIIERDGRPWVKIGSDPFYSGYLFLDYEHEMINSVTLKVTMLGRPAGLKDPKPDERNPNIVINIHSSPFMNVFVPLNPEQFKADKTQVKNFRADNGSLIIELIQTEGSSPQK